MNNIKNIHNFDLSFTISCRYNILSKSNGKTFLFDDCYLNTDLNKICERLTNKVLIDLKDIKFIQPILSYQDLQRNKVKSYFTTEIITPTSFTFSKILESYIYQKYQTKLKYHQKKLIAKDLVDTLNCYFIETPIQSNDIKQDLRIHLQYDLNIEEIIKLEIILALPSFTTRCLDVRHFINFLSNEINITYYNCYYETHHFKLESYLNFNKYLRQNIYNFIIIYRSLSKKKIKEKYFLINFDTFKQKTNSIIHILKDFENQLNRCLFKYKNIVRYDSFLYFFIDKIDNVDKFKDVVSAYLYLFFRGYFYPPIYINFYQNYWNYCLSRKNIMQVFVCIKLLDQKNLYFFKEHKYVIKMIYCFTKYYIYQLIQIKIKLILKVCIFQNNEISSIMKYKNNMDKINDIKLIILRISLIYNLNNLYFIKH